MLLKLINSDGKRRQANFLPACDIIDGNGSLCTYHTAGMLKRTSACQAASGDWPTALGAFSELSQSTFTIGAAGLVGDCPYAINDTRNADLWSMDQDKRILHRQVGY